MKRLVRWAKFNLVGVMGVAVQLSVLALLNRYMAGRYMAASAAAVEITLLHNFVWHTRYTWRDRLHESSRSRQLARFHLSNGVVSILGNLGLMRLLVHQGRLPLIAANAIAIACCSVANFYLGDWVFAQGEISAWSIGA